MLLHLIKTRIIGQILGKMIIGTQSIKICEHYISFNVSGILDL